MIGEQRRGNDQTAGDVFMLNTPYNGGTHLPDITVITPVFDLPGSGHEQDILSSMSPRAGTTPTIGGINAGFGPAGQQDTSTRKGS